MTEGWDPAAYLGVIRAEVPRYDELQERVVAATAGGRVERVLELGVGTGETAKRLLARHPSATLVGVDGSDAMLAAARASLPAERVELRLAQLEDSLPGGPFDVVVSVLAVHHLRGDGKAALFRGIARSLAAIGRFVLADVVVPSRPEDAVVPIDEGFDFPDPLADQRAWLEDAGFSVEVVWSWKDLAIVRAELQASV
jgi:tRNA (cmo5U34)-methyltransferase